MVNEILTHRHEGGFVGRTAASKSSSSSEQRDEGSARPEGGREAPALGAGRALPGATPRAGHLVGGPHRTDAIPDCEPEDVMVRCCLLARAGSSLATGAMAVEHPVAGIRGRARAGDGTSGLAQRA